MSGKRWMIGMLSLVLMVALSACGGTEESTEKKDEKAHKEEEKHDMHDSEEVKDVPKVEMTFPEEVKSGENIRIQVKIMQEDQPVNDADDVQFEIWEKGADKEDHEKIVAKRTGEGVYSIEKAFEKAGDYKVMYHVTARGSHVMKPAETLTVQQ